MICGSFFKITKLNWDFSYTTLISWTPFSRYKSNPANTQTNKQTDAAGLKRQPWWKWGMEEQYFLALSCLFTVAVAHTVSFESRRRRRERSRRAVARRCLAYFSLWARAELPPVFPRTYGHGDQTARTAEKARGSNTLPHWINNATAHSNGKLDKHARP